MKLSIVTLSRSTKSPLLNARDRKVFEQPDLLEDHQPFPDFQTYFESVVGQPFDKWGELERTHRFVADYKPELFAVTLEQATEERKQFEAKADVKRGERTDLPVRPKDGDDFATVAKSSTASPDSEARGW